MGKETAIAWTDHTFNPWWGCTRVSPGCEHCYAEAWAKRTGYAKGGKHLPIWGVDTERRAMSDAYWRTPMTWNHQAMLAGVRKRVFCASMADVFELVPKRNVEATRVMTDARRRLWKLIEQTPWLDWQLLTKRPENVLGLVPWAPGEWPMNVWLGTTAEDQEHYDDRWPLLAAVYGPAVHFVSYEPALGPLLPTRDTDSGTHPDWLIIGGESGPRARPFALEWAERALDVCATLGIVPFMKQLGDYVVSEGRTAPRDLTLAPEELQPHHYAPNGEVWAWRMGGLGPKGGNQLQWPAELRVQRFPQAEQA